MAKFIQSINNPPRKFGDKQEDIARDFFFLGRRVDKMEDNLNKSPNGYIENMEDYIRKVKRQHTKSDQVEDIKYNQTKKGTNDYN